MKPGVPLGMPGFLRSMRIIFSVKPTLLSGAIRRVTASKVSHVCFGLTIANVPVIVEAGLTGVVMVNEALWMSRGNVVVGESYLPNTHRPDVGVLLSFLGAPYDVRGFLSLGWALVLKEWLRRKVRAPGASPHALICSELIVRCMASTGREPWSRVDPEAVTPAGVEMLMAMAQ